MAYLITWTCYGTWLHGDAAGSADDEHNVPGTPYLPHDPQRMAAERKRMDQPPYSLDGPRREVVLNAIRQHCEYRGWTLHAVHVRHDHLHVVVSADATPERVMNDLKSYASRRLNEAGFDTKDRKRWTRHGSTRYLWDEKAVLAAIRYVWDQRGAPMSRWQADRSAPRSAPPPSSSLAAADTTPYVQFEIFEPRSDREVPPGTVSRAKATCLCCGAVLPPERVRAQLAAQRGGADVIFDESHPSDPRPQRSGAGKDAPLSGGHGAERPPRTGGARLLAVVTLKPGEQGRHYRLPTERDYQAVWKAQQRLKTLLDTWRQCRDRQGTAEQEPLPAGRGSELCPVPDEPLPPVGTLGFRVQRYGMMQWGDLFTARQKLALVTLARLARDFDARPTPLPKGEGAGVREAVRAAMATVVNRCADRLSTVCRWDNPWEKVANTFSRQALPFVWDFCEGHPYGGEGTGFDGALDWVVRVVEAWPARADNLCHAQAQQADATQHPLPNEAAQVWFTDPPYYDAVPYADLSDFFFVWLKRALPGHPLLRDPFDPANRLTPKTREVVQDETRSGPSPCPLPEGEGLRAKDRAWFEETMARAFAEGRRVLKEDGIGSVVFAHKTTEGWEALLSGMIRGGWTITGSWPIATEMATRLRARESAALATSVHLVCRPRPSPQPSPSGRGQGEGAVGDWADVLRELPRRVGDWMERLQSEGVRGADLVFACIGPALEIFSRYSRVETADGREVKLAEFLEKVWEVVGRTALEYVLGTAESKARNGVVGALEEDARLTALFLWTLQSTNGNVPSRDPSRANLQSRAYFQSRANFQSRAREEAADNGDAIDASDELSEEDEDSGEAAGAAKPSKGLTLIFDVVRRFAQPLGIHLPDWEGRIIETRQGLVRLLPVRERAEQLFGEAGASLAADQIEAQARRGPQATFDFMASDSAVPIIKGRKKKKTATSDVSDDSLRAPRGATTLDRVHAAMLLQASGRANALRALLRSEIDRGGDFLRLANALSALYPVGSDEKRLLDAMLLAVPR